MGAKEDRNKARTKEYLEAFTTWDPEVYGPLISDDIGFYFGHAEPRIGREAYDDMIRFAHGLYPGGVKMEFQNLIAEHDWVAIRLINRATVASGADYENFYCIVLRFTEDGHVLEHHEYLDTAYAETRFQVLS